MDTGTELLVKAETERLEEVVPFIVEELFRLSVENDGNFIVEETYGIGYNALAHGDSFVGTSIVLHRENRPNEVIAYGWRPVGGQPSLSMVDTEGGYPTFTVHQGSSWYAVPPQFANVIGETTKNASFNGS